jgi:phenylpyruvate tautomerase
MPLCRIVTSANVPEKSRAPFLAELSRFVAEALRKPERYVMTGLTTGVSMTFAGTSEPACYVELKNIGTFTLEQTATLSADLCVRIEKTLGVPASRTYIEFTNSAGHLWGHDGETFA